MANIAPAFDLGARALSISNELAATAADGVRRIAELNVRMAREALGASTDRIRDLLAARDAAALTELVARIARPGPESFSNYAREVYEISAETGNALAGALTRQAADSTVLLTEAIAALAANPGGNDPFGFVRQAMQATEVAYDQVSQAANRFVEAASGPAAQAEAWAEEAIVATIVEGTASETATPAGAPAEIEAAVEAAARPVARKATGQARPASAAKPAPKSAPTTGSASTRKGARATGAARKAAEATPGASRKGAAKKPVAAARPRTGTLWPTPETTARPAAKRLPRKSAG